MIWNRAVVLSSRSMGILVNERYINRSIECVKRKIGKLLFEMCKEKWVADKLYK